MNLHKVGLLVSVVGAFMGFVSAAHAYVGTGSFNYTGINYTFMDLTEDSSATHAQPSFLLDSRGFNQHADPSFPDSENIKSWDGKVTAIALLGIPVGGAWTLPIGSLNSGGYSGCGSGNGGLACAKASAKNLVNADPDSPSPTIQVVVASAASSSSAATGIHVGAVHENSLGAQEIHGIVSVTKSIPEPKIYAMMLAGLGLMGFVARRRHQGSAA